MFDSKIYCPVPWNEVHINADGTYHTCGAQPNVISSTEIGITHRIQKMSTVQWMHSDYQKQQRHDKLNEVASELCNMCYHSEAHGSSSKRERELEKYSTTLFLDPDVVPETDSFHVSLGNECNLACRMCSPTYSSKIAAQRILLGTWKPPAKLNWSEDDVAWKRFLDSICSSTSLKYVHIIGGEPLLNPRFENLIDALIQANLTSIYIGFTTNGTVINPALMNKLMLFKQVDIGISIECMGVLNDYIRQGSSTDKVLNNIEFYLQYRKESQIYVTVRNVPSALSIHTIKELYQWCVDRKVDVMINSLINHEYMQIKHLPQDVKARLLTHYQDWKFDPVNNMPRNSRDPADFKLHIDTEIRSLIHQLSQPNNVELTHELYKKLQLWNWFSNPTIASYFETSYL